ncbi:MAG: hypothetical protein JW807_02035 [Spirochaetes bacterium]|nr:hypothetical protein [Spirochaetota bacterium]
MTSKHEIKPVQQFTNEYVNIHPSSSRKCLQIYDTPAASSSSISVFESITKYYSSLDNSAKNESYLAINNCFAVRLSLFLIELISEKKFHLSKKGTFTRSFYRHCTEKASETGLTREINDDELFIKYVRQCIYLLQITGILRLTKAYGVINREAVSEKTLYGRLLHAFWNEADWEEIFTSDPESAKELKINKCILKDLLLRHYCAIYVQNIANEFFDMTGFCSRNNLFMISFIDFYLFTWLKHFGMLRYVDEPPNAPVRIAVTEAGRNILSSI